MNNLVNLGTSKPAGTWQPRLLKPADIQLVAGGARYVGSNGSVYYRVNGVWWVEDAETRTSHKL